MFSVSGRTVSKIWKRGIKCIVNGVALDVSSNIQKHAGRKMIQFDFATEVPKIHLSRRTNIRSLAMQLKMKQTTLFRRIKEGVLRSHSNVLKPYLTDEGKKSRVQFCLSMLEPSSLNNDPVFKDMYNYVHIDEKWFLLTKESERYYLLPEENEPERTCKSKRFITKVMFLCAVPRPRYDSNVDEIFSGKIGFPFIYKEPAKRNSRNRLAGTMETKSMTSVTKEVIRSYLIEKVLPAIRAKWPRDNGSNCLQTIYIQQDNAKPHIHQLDPQFSQAASAEGFDIRLTFQSPNSPDLNVLDLGFFRAIASLQHQEAPSTIDELVYAVEKSFDALSSNSLNSVFLSYQCCMVEVMKAFGGNKYKLPHMGKNKMIRAGNLPTQLRCDRDVVEQALAYLANEIN